MDPSAQHGRHAGHSVAMFQDRLVLSLLLTIPTLIWGHMLQGALGYTAPSFPASHWIPAFFGTLVFGYGGWPFLQGAARELRSRLPGMMTLIALAISVAFGFSAAVTLGYPGMPLWEELATLVTIMLLGHWIEMRSIAQARGALAELASLLPDTATRVSRTPEGERLEEVPVAQLREGDVILIRPGARVPADGEVVDGTTTLDESMITGESRPVQRGPGALRWLERSTGQARSVCRLPAPVIGRPWRASCVWSRKPRLPAPEPRYWPTVPPSG